MWELSLFVVMTFYVLVLNTQKKKKQIKKGYLQSKSTHLPSRIFYADISPAVETEKEIKMKWDIFFFSLKKRRKEDI